MNEEEFNKAIQSLQEKKLPSCPSNLEANVLRKIHQNQVEEEGFWNWLGKFIPKTGFVMAALAMVMATSSVITVVSTTSYAAENSRQIEVKRALGFDFAMSTELLMLTER